MIFSEYWSRLQLKNPGLREENKIRMTVSSFKQCLEQAFDEGNKARTKRQENMEKIMEKAGGKSLWESVFGHKANDLLKD
jgi:hypothetical protein